jgi:Short repeat of unknown function (DUF308)
MALSLDAAAEVFREAMREAVKRYWLWYLIQGILLIGTGILAIIYPVLSSAVIVLLGWLLIISGIVQDQWHRSGPGPYWCTPRSAFLAIAHLRQPCGADRLLVPARSGSGHGDDCAASHRLFHDGRHLKDRVRADNRTIPELGPGAGERAGWNRVFPDLGSQLAIDGCMADRVSVRHQPDQRRRGDYLSRLAGAAELMPGGDHHRMSRHSCPQQASIHTGR